MKKLLTNFVISYGIVSILPIIWEGGEAIIDGFTNAVAKRVIKIQAEKEVLKED